MHGAELEPEFAKDPTNDGGVDRALGSHGDDDGGRHASKRDNC